MSKKRYIDTTFWADNWIASLSKEERYFFLYLLTNDKTSIAGIYQIPLKIIIVETDLTQDEVITMFHKMKARVMYVNGWVVMRNGIKNQNYRNSKIRRGIEIILEESPTELFEFVSFPKDFDYKLVEKSPQQGLFDESSMSHGESLHSNSNSNSNLIPIEADKSAGTKQVLSGSAKRQYAIAMDKEREQKERANKSFARKGSGLESAKAVAEKIRGRKKG